MIVVPTESNVLAVLRTFIMSVLPSAVEVVRGQDNRVPEPQSLDFVVMTPIRRERLETNVDTSTDILAGQVAYMQPTRIVVQLDVHGPGSAENAQIVSTMFRDGYAVDQFAASGFDVAPLHADDPRQMTFVNGEDQYETRWVVEAAVQANQVVTSAPQQFADVVSATLVDVDTLPQ